MESMMTIDKNTACEISKLFEEASVLCDKSLRTVMANESLGQVKVYGRLVAQFMGHSYTNILAPIWKAFPELMPEAMKQEYIEPEPQLSEQSREALQTFLNAAQAARSFAGDSAYSAEFEKMTAFGGIKEVEGSIAAIAEFLESPRFSDAENEEG